MRWATTANTTSLAHTPGCPLRQFRDRGNCPAAGPAGLSRHMGRKPCTAWGEDMAAPVDRRVTLMTAPSTGSVSRDTSGCSACTQPGTNGTDWRNDMSLHHRPIGIREHNTCNLMGLHLCCTACEDASSQIGPKARHHLHYGCRCNHGIPCQMRLPCMASLAPHHGIEPGAGCHKRSCLQEETCLRPLLWQKNGHQLQLKGPRWSKMRSVSCSTLSYSCRLARQRATPSCHCTPLM